MVDFHAKIANLERPQDILLLFQSLNDHYQYSHSQLIAVHRHLLCTYRLFETSLKEVQVDASSLDISIRQTTSNVPLQACPPLVPPEYAHVVMPAPDQIFPIFIYGNTFGQRLIRYFAQLQWPTNVSAKALCPRVCLGDLMMDFIFSTQTYPPVRSLQGRGVGSLHFDLMDVNSNVHSSFTNLLLTFSKALALLSEVINHEVAPGISKAGLRANWIHVGTTFTNHRCLPHGPKTLLSSAQVARWKHQMAFQHSTASAIAAALLVCPFTGPPLIPVDDIPIEPIDYATTVRARDRFRYNALRAGEPVRNSHRLFKPEPPLFRDAG